jgi:hypothetical protein
MFKNKGKRWAEEDDKFLREHYNHKNAAEMALKLGRTRDSVWSRAKHLGITNYAVNHSFFNDWNNPGMPWLLGFWAADGCLSKQNIVSFSQSHDRETIEKIKEMLESEHKVGYEAWADSWHLAFTSREMCSVLSSIFGLQDTRKSRTIRWPDVPSGKGRGFIRGLIDGDGCLSLTDGIYPAIGFVSGSESFVNGFSECVYSLTGIKAGVFLNKHNGGYYWRVAGFKAALLCLWLYKGNKEYSLERKYSTAMEFAEWRPTIYRRTSISKKMCEVFSEYIPLYVRNRIYG